MKLLKLCLLLLGMSSSLFADINDELLKAVQACEVGKVESLIIQGANINVRDIDGVSPLILAVMHNNMKMVRCLVGHSAGLDIHNVHGSTALTLAMDSRREIAEILIEHGASVNIPDGYGNTPLILAVRNGKRETVRCLLEHRAEVNIQSSDSNTALIWAAWRNDIEMVRFLIGHGAGVNIQNNNGTTALIWAALNNNIEMVSCLVEHGAEVNIQSSDGDTALILAARTNRIEIVRYLVEHGADGNIQNRWGNTALSESSGDVRKYLESYLENFEQFKLDPLAFTQQQINLNQRNLLGELPFNECEESEVQSVPLQQLLFWSITLDYEDVFYMLLREGFWADNMRIIPLKLAAQQGSKKILRSLLYQANSETVLQVMKWAADSGQFHIATWLLMRQKGYGDIGI